jgi:hypothetical protein
MLLGAMAEPWTLLQALGPLMQGIFVPPPPCPAQGGFPQDIIYYSVDMVRRVVWGQPC